MSPTISLQWAIRRLCRYSSREERAELRLITQARTPLQPPMTQRLMIHTLWDCWLHRCTHRREKQVQTHHEFITLIEKIRCQVHHSFDKMWGIQHRGAHTKKSQAQSFIPIQGEFSENVTNFRGSWNCEQIQPLEDNRKLFPDSLERNFVREFFLRKNEVKYSQRQDPKYFCRDRELRMPTVRYKV